MKGHVILALTMVAVCAAVTGKKAVQDSVILRVFNKDFRMSDSEMLALLKKVNLERHGFKKEVVTKFVRRPGDKKPDYVRTLYYYKIVSCAKAYKVVKKLNKLLEGVLGAKVLRKVKKDLSEKNLDDPRRMCQAGIEIHFRNQQQCRSKKDQVVKRCWFFCGGACNGCTGCSAIKEI